MKKYKIDFDLINKIVNITYNYENIFATSIEFEAKLIFSYAFYPKNQDDENNEINGENQEKYLNYYTLEVFKNLDEYYIIKRNSLNDTNKNIIEKDIKLNIDILSIEFINNNLDFNLLYNLIILNEDEDLYVKNGYFEGLKKLCSKLDISTVLKMN